MPNRAVYILISIGAMISDTAPLRLAILRGRLPPSPRSLQGSRDRDSTQSTEGGAKMGRGTRWCNIRMGDAAVPVRCLPFRIGQGWESDIVVGSGASCSILIQRTRKLSDPDPGLELVASNGAFPLVNGHALGDGRRRSPSLSVERRALINGDVVAIGGGLQFVVENISGSPGRGSPGTAEELSALDWEEEALWGDMARIVRQRRGVSVLTAVQNGDVQAALDGLDEGGHINEPLGDVGSLLHVAVEQKDLAMVRALLA